ncbi:MAG: hypothetical protein JWN15_3427, partial [Firmicutes bacterium]|nr:hypothetical protein [Bacillota bacterium]
MRAEILTRPWQRLAGEIALEVLIAPKTCGDPRNKGEWPEVEEQVVAYLENNVIGRPWADHLALAALVMTARRRQGNTVLGTLNALSPRLTDLFPVLGYESMQDWNPTEACKAYLRGEVLPDHTDNQRSWFWNKYSTASNQVRQWLKSLPTKEQEVYGRFALPVPDRGELYEVKKLGVQVRQEAKKNRKTATDAVVPSLPTIRAKAQLRLNRLTRVRQAYHDALNELQNGKPYTLPFSYHYDEGEDKEQRVPPQERLYFRIWDRRTFVLAHQDHYSGHSLKAAENKTGAYSDENNRFFLEFVWAERLVGDGPAEGLWFEDLLRRQLLGQAPRHGTDKAIRATQEYLRAWGYGDEEKPDTKVCPFEAKVSELLAWPKCDSAFMSDAQLVAEGVLVPVKPLYAGAMFGLLALDIFTTTGMRINEAMQIRMSPDCLKRVTQPAPPEAADHMPRERVCLMLIPKGERRDEPHPYYIGTAQLRLMQKTLHMLREHYRPTGKEHLPAVPFSSDSHRSFR